MVSWNWNESASESGVVHQSVANTDHDDATILKQGYDYATFSEITPDPIACWPFHEDSGTTANDVAGTNDGTYNGPSLGSPSILGTTAPTYDGIDDAMNVPSAVVGDVFTVCSWVRSDGNGDPEETIANTYHNYSDDVEGFYYRYKDTGDFVGRYGDGSNSSTITATVNPFDDVYHLASCIVDANNGELRLNFDGAQVASNTNTAQLTISHGTDFRTGQQVAGNARHFSGEIASMWVYDQKLTQSQIQTLYDVVDTTGSWTSTVKTL